MCLAGVVVASRSLAQEVARLSPFTVIANIFVTEFAEFSETFRKNSNIPFNKFNVTVYKTFVSHFQRYKQEIESDIYF